MQETADSVRRRSGLHATALAAALMVAGSPAFAQAAKAALPVRGGTAVFALGGDPGSSNPAITTSIADVMIGCMVYEGLTRVTTDLKVLPHLARSWTVSPDGLTYTFKLQAAKWHDGKPFTSADVKFSLGEVNAKFGTVFRTAGALIQAIDAPAPDSVVIKLKEPFGPFLMSLSCIEGGAILPAHVFKGTDIRANPASNDKPVGTGPFKLGEWKRGEHVKMVKNADYWQAGKPYLDAVLGKVIPNASSRLQALQAGEIDLIQGYNLPSNDLHVARAHPALKLETSGYAPASSMLMINTKKKPFDDARVRQALMMATDREYLLKSAWFGDGVVSTGPFNSVIAWARNADVDYRKSYPFSYEKSNKLLDEAGFKRNDGGSRMKVKVAYASDAGDRAQVALALKSMWRNVGVDVEIESLERTAQMKRVFTDRDFDISIEALNTFGDPALGITRTYRTETIGLMFGNAPGYSNPQVDALFLQAQRASKVEDRGNYYKQAAAIVAKDLPVLALRDSRFIDAASRKLHGVWETMGPGDWTNAWIQK